MASNSTRNPERSSQVLLLEDSPSDRLLTKLALEESGVPHQLHVVEYGIDLLRFLRQEPPYTNAPRPDLILLDLNVPRMDGREILRLVKVDPFLTTIPVVVLTTSSHPSDIRTAYEGRANGYLRKPADFAHFVDTMRTTMRFWCELIEPAPSPATPAMVETSPSLRGERSLLLVEDSPSDAALVRAALVDAAAPYTVTHVTRLTDAIDLMQHAQFDIVISDLSLPDSTGVETIRLLAATGQAAPIIALTGSYSDVGEAALTAGADDFLPKGDLSPVRLERILRHAIRRRLIQLEELQNQRVHTVGRLAASVAHDMNNLLAAVRLSTEAILTPGADTPDIAKELLANVERGAALTRQLLTFGRRSEQHRVQCEVNGAVTSASAWIARLLRQNVVLSMDLTDAPTTVMADMHQLEQAIVNLALNANDAMPSGGRLELATKVRFVDVIEGTSFDPPVAAGTYVIASVRDTGVGIPSDILPNLFEPFFTTKAEHEGTGLGLATVRDVARLHLGGVRAANRPEGGAEFTVAIPYIPTATTLAGGRPIPGAELPGRSPFKGTTEAFSLLLAEDDDSVARATARVLRSHGYRVEIVGSADDAWHAWSTAGAGFDLLVTDLLMPGTMSVGDLVQSIHAVDDRFPIVFCSGYAGTALEQSLALVESVNFVAKPFETRELLAVVERQLARSVVPNLSQGSSSAPS